jgi:hypothetical protein
VDESAAGASGCSVDAMVRSMTTLERELGVELVKRSVLYRVNETIVRDERRRSPNGRVAARCPQRRSCSTIR